MRLTVLAGVVRLAIVVGIVAPTTARGAETFGSLAQRLPAQTCLAIFSDDVSQTCEAFQKTRLGEKLGGPDFKPLIDELARLNLASALRLRPAFGFDWSDLAKVREPGGVAFFPLTDGSLGSAWLFVSDANGASEPACLVAAAAYFKGQGYRDTVTRTAARTLTIWQPPAARKEESPKVTFVANGIYGVANSQAAAEMLLGISADKSLASAPAFQKLGPSVATEDAAAVRFFLQPLQLGELVQKTEAAAKKETTPQPAKDAKAKSTPVVKNAKSAAEDKKANAKKNKKSKDPKGEDDIAAAARRLGWDGLQAVAGTVSFRAAAPLEWQLQATALAPTPYRGAMRMLEIEPGPLGELPPWIRGNAINFTTWQWNFSHAMKGFGNLFDEANEPGPDGEGLFEDMLDGLRDDAEGVQVDLRRDVFEHLGPHVYRVVMPTPPPAPVAIAGRDKQSDHPWLIATEVRDSKTVLAALVRFYKGDDRVRHTKSGKFDVWTVGAGASLFVEGESDSVVNVRALALGQGQLLFSTSLDLLNEALQGPPGGAPLRSDAAWTRLREWIKTKESDQTAIRSFARLDEVLEPSYQLAMQKSTDEPDSGVGALWRLLLFGNSKGAEAVSDAAVPKFDALRAGLPPAALVLSRTAEGWSVSLGILAPDSTSAP